MTRHRLTPELQAMICRYILSGGFPQVAAEAAGLPRAVFARWLARGQARRAKRKYRLFWEAVLEALAQVRLAAEAKALVKDPLAWLKCGPGKDTPGAPGWTNPVRGQTARDAPETPLLLHKEVSALMTSLLDLLSPYPEARAAVASALVAEELRPTTDNTDNTDK